MKLGARTLLAASAVGLTLTAGAPRAGAQCVDRPEDAEPLRPDAGASRHLRPGLSRQGLNDKKGGRIAAALSARLPDRSACGQLLHLHAEAERRLALAAALQRVDVR